MADSKGPDKPEHLQDVKHTGSSLLVVQIAGMLHFVLSLAHYMLEGLVEKRNCCLSLNLT